MANARKTPQTPQGNRKQPPAKKKGTPSKKRNKGAMWTGIGKSRPTKFWCVLEGPSGVCLLLKYYSKKKKICVCPDEHEAHKWPVHDAILVSPRSY